MNQDYNQYYGPSMAQQLRIGDEKFFNRTLKGLMKNEESIKQYFGKRMLWTASNKGEQHRERGEFHCCTSDGWLDFSYVKGDIHPNKELLHGIYASWWMASAIDDIKLIEYEPDNYKYNPDQKDDDLILGKSVKNELWDEARHKLIQYALFKLIPLYPEFEAFDIKYRKQYLKKSTKDSIKREIGDKICELKIPQSLSENPRFLQLFQNAIFDEDRIKTNRSCYDLANALSLLNDYHQLWIQHIKDTSEENKIEDDQKESSSKNTFRTNYTDWDDWQLNVPQYNPTGIGTEMQEPPIYFKPKNSILAIPPMTTKAEDIRINSIFPYDFVGPCFKFKKNNPDWRCMQCNGESKTPLQFITSPQHQKDDERIYFYKSKRTDMTIEICVICVNTYIAINGRKELQRKSLKFSKRKCKRLRKTLNEYNRKGMPYTPPTVQAGLPFYGIQPTMPYPPMPYPTMPYPSMRYPPIPYLPPMATSQYPMISNNVTSTR